MDSAVVAAACEESRIAVDRSDRRHRRGAARSRRRRWPHRGGDPTSIIEATASRSTTPPRLASTTIAPGGNRGQPLGVEQAARVIGQGDVDDEDLRSTRRGRRGIARSTPPVVVRRSRRPGPVRDVAADGREERARPGCRPRRTRRRRPGWPCELHRPAGRQFELRPATGADLGVDPAERPGDRERRREAPLGDAAGVATGGVGDDDRRLRSGPPRRGCRARRRRTCTKASAGAASISSRPTRSAAGPVREDDVGVADRVQDRARRPVAWESEVDPVEPGEPGGDALGRCRRQGQDAPGIGRDRSMADRRSRVRTP